MKGHRRISPHAVAVGFYLVASLAGCGGDSGPTALQTPNDFSALRPYWDAALAYMQSLPGQVYGLGQITSYPTEPAMTFVSAYLATGDARYQAAAERQLAFARSLERPDHLLAFHRSAMDPDTLIQRDYVARQIYNFAIAARLLDRPTYLQWADNGAQAMIDHLRRAPHVCADGLSRKLFAVNYSPVNYDSTSGRLVDLNQNAEIGLTFTLLYHDPASRLYHAATADSIAHAELYASIAAQRSPGGELPLHESGCRADEYDTLYGSYTVFSWILANHFWHEDGIQNALSLAARWLTQPERMALVTSSRRYYISGDSSTYDCNGGRNRPARFDECWYRLMLYWQTVAIPPDLRRIWARRALDQVILPENPMNLPTFVTPFCYFRLVGMPDKEYGPDS